ncbi:GNAT family N-acetyltransferase [Pseudogemmobacter faecipullorum]|uniref:N-acetyltransferase n=1 Tax=Pseudogemmobacter faecipullorum TaxID=2755041 RepID=A0ABS8CGX5_9RHOB|nr:GNAT family N-acetyltransferase [Pseudogemmobacter faecipullorum]MCB5408435.1 N-acetyltransferase [Pseudogemmobacter faecipullorum]
MAEPVIRPVCAGDAPAIVALWNPWILETAVTFNPAPKAPGDITALLAARQAAGHGFYLAEDAAGDVLGFAGYSQFRAGEGYARSMEHTVILRPGARGRGLGRALMRRLEDHARAAGHHLMIAGVSGENPAGRAFHEAIGYQLWGSIPGAGYKFGRHMDLWLLGKVL